MMSVAASRIAIERAGIDTAQVDAVIVATISHLLQLPAVATALAHELGLQRPVAFDISAACAGVSHRLPQIGRAHVCTPVTPISRTPFSSFKQMTVSCSVPGELACSLFS